jgi:hypothetical protein
MVVTSQLRPSLVAYIEGSGLMDCVDCGLLAFAQNTVLENCDWSGVVICTFVRFSPDNVGARRRSMVSVHDGRIDISARWFLSLPTTARGTQ